MFENSSNLTSSMLFTSFDQLLDSLGFNEWVTIVTLFVMPIISLTCLIMCSLSAWIFFQKKFTDPVFIYYRLLCLVYILQLAHGIPLGILYSNRFLLRYFSYFITLYLWSTIICWRDLALIHFEDTLHIGHSVNTHENIQFVCEKTFHAKASANCFKSFSHMSFHR